MSKATTRPALPIDRLEYVQNIGRFDSVRGNADTAFGPLSPDLLGERKGQDHALCDPTVADKRRPHAHPRTQTFVRDD